VLLELSPDQELFRETTARYLREQVPPAELRRLRDDPAGFDAEYWRRGADLGWTSLLVGEAHGGGSISGDGLVDLTLVAHEIGRHAAPGPLGPTNVVAAALSRASDGSGSGSDTFTPVLAELMAGTATAAWCYAEPRPHDRLGAVTLDVRVDEGAGEVVVHGVKRPVESAARAAHLLVTGRTGAGLTQVLVPAGTPGVSIAPMQSVDLTRRFDVVTFDQVRVAADRVVGEIGAADDTVDVDADAAGDVDRQLQLAVVIANAEAVGAMQAAFEMTVEWAFDRHSFGRTLASYQALKHRFADMKAWLEASHAVGDAAAAAVGAGAPEAAELVSAAKAFIGDHGSELLHDCVQIHGGIGVTFEHDLHLFLRRQTVDRALHGTPAEHRRRLADIVERRADAA
jgi:alkylation response protein AidB-like acyl-CoA dehydrogenase